MRTRSNDTPDGFSLRPRRPRQMNRSWQLWLTLILAIFAMTACSASVGLRPSVAGYAVAPVNNVPGSIQAYPRYYYRDRYAYLVDGQWYYPTNDGWVVFLDVPAPLAQYRAQVQSAPPAARPPDVYYGYPPPVQQPPPPTPPQELDRQYRPR